ncbi:MAG: hypothetical protein KC423_06025 [Anaerolineales bacterium]|nr:hypothetical protein [Anaerolineales bacterium]MCA9963776.1 hypothetical protein [Anaerolineales bacterium]
MQNSKVSKRLGIAIVIIQLLDIIIHVALGRPEPLRIVSNIVILSWMFIVQMGWLEGWKRPFSFIVIGIYALLNLIFIVLPNILTTPELIFMLAVFVFPTLGLSAWRTKNA